MLQGRIDVWIHMLCGCSDNLRVAWLWVMLFYTTSEIAQRSLLRISLKISVIANLYRLFPACAANQCPKVSIEILVGDITPTDTCFVF